MKIAIIGAGGFRTPLLIRSILKRLDRLHLNELSLLDIDEERLNLVGALTQSTEEPNKSRLSIQRTTNPQLALSGADFVITTFRIGGIESRVIDERIPLRHGILGQETTGPGGFAMGIRSIPELVRYVQFMQSLCPTAWLINFANPAGMLTEAVIRYTDWSRIIGICDAPSVMHKVIAALLGITPESVYIDYFGLNHLGWIKQVIIQNTDHLPGLINYCKNYNQVPGLPFSPDLIASLKLIPNEYLYYYYYASQSVNNILSAEECRGEQITRLNNELIRAFRRDYKNNDSESMLKTYESYLQMRGETYMKAETGKGHNLSNLDPKVINSIVDEGYAGVALDLIEALNTGKSIIQILNVPNHGAISEMEENDVVEIPTLVNQNHIEPLATSNIPSHCLGLIKQVKEYEHLTIEAAITGSYDKAVLALTIHPLVRDFTLAKVILDEYITGHKEFFPQLN